MPSWIVYTLFAVASTIANIASQAICLRFYGGEMSIVISVFVGTAVGLITKYVLDKRFIFRFETRDAIHNLRTFALYAMMGGVTTLIFWVFEFAFYGIFETSEAKYAGAIMGLAIGYYVKYALDKQYVFTAKGEV